jgi:phenylalanine-4-hydroxylase
MDKNSKKQELLEIVKKLTNEYKQEWLLRVEIVELLTKDDLLLEEQIILKEQLEEIKLFHEEYPFLIERGLMLASY